MAPKRTVESTVETPIVLPTALYDKLKRAGLGSWAALGIIALIFVSFAALSAVSTVVIPLLIAVILGTILEPVCLWLERLGVGRALAAVITLVLAILAFVALITVVFFGFLQQIPEIASQLTRGWQSLTAWALTLELDSMWLERIKEAVGSAVATISQGAVGVVVNTVYGMVSFALAAFFALFFLFFVMRDVRAFPKWIASSANLDAELTEEVTELAKDSIRAYFKGTAITALITAPFFMIPLLVMRIPLAIPLFILYFFLSFIPYLGAWITAVVAVLIAFGAGGPVAALVIAISLLVSNGTIQNVVYAWALGTSLKLHAVTVLIATLVGGVIGGMMGMVLAPPLLAAARRSLIAINNRRSEKIADLGEVLPDVAVEVNVTLTPPEALNS